MIDDKILKKFKTKYEKDSINEAMQGAISTVGIDAASKNQDVLRRHDFTFSVENTRPEATNQKKSGRCWMFAAFNTMRQGVIEKLKVDNFEFSETYLFFYDKLEKANTFLENIIKTADEELDSRIMRHLLLYTVPDGGYWDFFAPLVRKYGAVPKSVMPESFHSEDTYMFEKQMDLRLRKAAKDIRNAHKDGKKAEIKKIKEEALYSIYNIARKVLGTPVEKFDFRYQDKDKKFHIDRDLTPKQFFEKYVGMDKLDKIIAISDPREKYPYGKRLQCDYVKSVYEEEAVNSLNIPLDVLKKATVDAIKDGQYVWFACDVGKDIDRKNGILDSELFNYDLTLTEVGEFSKAEKLEYGYSHLSHAMVFVGVDLDEKGEVRYFKVDNSWGDDLGRKGIFSMSAEWFDENNYECVLDKKYIPKKYLKGLEEEAIKLEPWDPIV